MGENLDLIIGLIVALLGIPVAILGLKKAHFEWKKAKMQKGEAGEKESIYVNKTDHGSSAIIGSTVIRDVSITNKTELHENNTDESIILKDCYTSVLAEKGKILNEKITIRNLGNGKIEGNVYLNQHDTYVLNGTFRNGILTGEFSSVGKYTDERGTINLKLLSENILSGFCSFSKISNLSEDQIRMSPYVWVAGEDVNLLNGTYEFCTECHNERKQCCCSSPDVDMPVLLKNESQKIQSLNPRFRKMKEFSHNIKDTSVRQVNEINKQDGERHCHFYDVSKHQCTIYDIRPVDCRLFPFDIKLDEKTNEYWIGYYSDVCDRKLPDVEKMKLYAHVLRPQLFILFPYANTINDKSVCERLNNATFEKLYRLEEFIF